MNAVNILATALVTASAKMSSKLILNKNRPAAKSHEAAEAPYLDYLQSPLQPLMDNLESQTYEAFEKDPVKYKQYELAITAALLDTPPDKVTLLMVVGAGRGPLVKAAINASKDANRVLRIVAVEKNANAVITLRNMAIMERWDNVTIVATDMRSWKTDEKLAHEQPCFTFVHPNRPSEGSGGIDNRRYTKLSGVRSVLNTCLQHTQWLLFGLDATLLNALLCGKSSVQLSTPQNSIRQHLHKRRQTEHK
eukprot:20223-Heterococcus_DN1.PRE.2